MSRKVVLMYVSIVNFVEFCVEEGLYNEFMYQDKSPQSFFDSWKMIWARVYKKYGILIFHSQFLSQNFDKIFLKRISTLIDNFYSYYFQFCPFLGQFI